MSNDRYYGGGYPPPQNRTQLKDNVVPLSGYGNVNFDQTMHQIQPFEQRYGSQQDWIPEFVNEYAINDIGQLLRVPHITARDASVNLLEVKINGSIGAPAYVLKKTPYYIAVLVLRTFCRYENRYEIPFHKDGSIFNHDLSNLEWRDYRHTNDRHRKAYAVMWKKHIDDVNYVPHPHAGKKFKNGVPFVEPKPPPVNPKPVIEAEVVIVPEPAQKPTRKSVDDSLMLGFGTVTKANYVPPEGDDNDLPDGFGPKRIKAIEYKPEEPTIQKEGIILLGWDGFIGEADE